MRSLHEMSLDAALEVVRVRNENRRLGRPLDAEFERRRDAMDDRADEKAVAARGVKQLQALGFIVVNYSQPRATKQTPGVQDKELFHPERGVFLKWEVKTPRGKPSTAQVHYAEWCAACGVPYLCGTDQDLFAWLVAQGIAFVEGGLLVPLPYNTHSPRG